MARSMAGTNKVRHSPPWRTPKPRGSAGARCPQTIPLDGLGVERPEPGTRLAGARLRSSAGFAGGWRVRFESEDRRGTRVHGMSIPEHDHEIKIKGGSIELSDLGHLLPGMAEIMPLVGARIWKCYYAGKARNRALARFQLSEAVNLMEKGAILRPKYAEDIEKFVSQEVAAVRSCIESEDWEGFERAFAAMVENANGYHEKYDKGFLRWKVPDEPPPDLDMTAGL